MSVATESILTHEFLSSSFSKAALMFRYTDAPTKASGTLLHLMVLPSHTSPLNPQTSPFFETNENPSPLFRTMPPRENRIVRVDLSRLRDVMVPISSPMDLAASMAAHFPLFPSRKSSVYPLLNVFAVSGTKPPVTLPYEPLSYCSGCFPTSSSNAME